MIRLIMTPIITCQGNNSLRCANYLLDAMEAQGILPPKYYKDVNDFAMSYCDNPGELIEVYAVNEWEKE